MEAAYIWFLASILFFFVEAFGVSGIGLLFAAIAAFCVGIVLQMGFLDSANPISQGATFFSLTAFWAAVLWKPMKNIHFGKPRRRHHDMVGRIAVVGEEGLYKGKTGNVTWSGTTMRARMADDAAMDEAVAGEELMIVKVDGSTLVLAEKDFPLPSNND